MSSLSAFRKNVYSQHGEDGILEEILRRLEIRTGSFVEFGAWDGKHLSNTFHLLEQGWGGVYIEGFKERFQKLVDNMKPFSERVELLNVYVDINGANSLDNLLASTRIAPEFEVLSIDIDSWDWHIWESLQNYFPTIVIIEINTYVPVGIYQTHRGNGIKGSSFTSTVELGKKKGYTLVCHTGGNLFFVKNNVVPQLQLPEADIAYPEMLFDYRWMRINFEMPLPPGMNRLSRFMIKWTNRYHAFKSSRSNS